MHSVSETSADASASPTQRQTHWWHPVPETGRIVCDLCPRACSLKPGDRGFCFVRENRDGQMLLSTYGRSTGFCIDPIEKKPLNHFYPGTSVLSFGTAGCNLGCKFCQNWDISKSRDVERLSQAASPEAIATAARELGCRSVAFTYNDPVVWAEYAIDTARACREQGIKTVAVTAGYITPEARGPFYEFMDAANVDLKAFTEDFYWHLTQAHLQPVLDTLRWLKHETDVWFEITNLVIPQANDSYDEFRRMCGWVLENLGDQIPLHFTAFHPDFRMMDRPATPHATLLAAQEIARQAGLKFVYVGNVHDRANAGTYCPGCGELLIERDWHQVHAYRLQDNRCGKCGATIAGRFDAQCGVWNGRRELVDMSRYARSNPGLLPIVQRPDPAVQPSVPQTRLSAGMLSLSPEQQRRIHRAASLVVRACILRLADQPIDGDLAGAAGLPVWGAFVTLKRQGRLRSCCGQMGGLTLVDAVKHAAARAAREDLRLPAISPTELEFLDLEVTLLYDQQPLAARGEARAAAIQPGRHGLVLQRGQASALFLPQVAVEHQWDSQRFLRELCVKAGLATTAWKQDDTQLWTFEGFSISGPFDAGTPVIAPAARFGPLDVDVLNEHCRKNLLAFVSGAVACYYLPGGPDGNVNGILLTVRGGAGEEFVTASHIDLLKSAPLQATAYQLVEAVTTNLRQQGIASERLAHCQVSLVVLTDPAMHGSALEPDLRGIDPLRRTVLAMHNGTTSWAYDPAKSPPELLAAATAPLPLPADGQAGVFSFATATTAPRAHGTIKPRPASGGQQRPPAVAGTFYPDDPQQLARTLDELLGAPAVAAGSATAGSDTAGRAEVRDCSAVLLPHAGYRFSGQLAAATLQATRIPETVIILGPKHTNLGVDWAVAPHAVWQLPGMAVPSDVGLARRLAEAIPGLTLDAAAHQREHAIEVELPLIGRLAPGARVVGIVMGSGNWERCQAFATGLAEVIRGMPQPPLLVISSDMNHFAADAENRELDALALAKLAQLDARGLYHTVREHHISMCGMLPAVVVLETLRLLGRLHGCRRIGYATSADATGDTSRVVGYAGMTFGADAA